MDLEADMSGSLEAMAMAGMDYSESGITFEDLELGSATPTHLLAYNDDYGRGKEEEEEEEEEEEDSCVQRAKKDSISAADLDTLQTIVLLSLGYLILTSYSYK